MADDINLASGDGLGPLIATDQIGTKHYQIIKFGLGALDSLTLASGGAGAVDSGTLRTTLASDDPAVALLGTIDADTGSIATDAGTLAGAVSGARVLVNPIVGQAGVAAGAGAVGATVQRVTLASDDPLVAAIGSPHISDFDTGAGTDNTPAFGIAVPANGGAAVVPGDATAGLKVNLGADNDVTVTGTVDLGATDNAVLDDIAASTATIASAVSTEMQVDVVGALPTGDNNIGNVDIVTLPAGNLGMQLMAASLSVVPASNITDATYIGDIKFGEALPAGTNNIGDVDVLTVPADPFGANADAASATGSISAKLRFIAATGIPITALPASTNTLEVVGDVAHDSAIGGNPVRIAGRALSADYTAVAAGDTADLITTLLGKLVVYPYALPGSTWSYAAASGGITDTTGVTAKAAGGAGVRNYITSAQVINGHATVSTDIQIRDGASGTVLWRGFAQAAGGGASVKFDPPLRGTANTLVEVACGTTGSATYFNLQGFTAAE